MLNLSNLKISKKSKRARIVVGRGNASGKGNFSGRGTKGQRSRTGGSNKLKRLGMRRIIMSTPKLRGFTSLRLKTVPVNVGDLEKAFQSGDHVTVRALQGKGLIDNLKFPVKILGQGQITKALTIAGCACSQGALEKITKAGGRVEGGAGRNKKGKSPKK